MHKETILIVEDEFIVAHDLQMILTHAGYKVAGTADSVKNALILLDKKEVDLVLLDIFLKGKQTGIDLAKMLMERQTPFIYISANSNERVLEAAKSTLPYGFIVKPYREKDVLLSIDIARYRTNHSQNLKISSKLFMEDFIVSISMKPLSRQKKLIMMAGAFQPYVPFDFLVLIGVTEDHIRFSEVGISRKEFDDYELVPIADLLRRSGIDTSDQQGTDARFPMLMQDAIFTGAAFDELLEQTPIKKIVADTYDLKSNLIKSIRLENGDLITLSFYSRLPHIFKQEHLDLLHVLEPTLSHNLEHIIELEKTGVSEHDNLNQGAATFNPPHDLKFPTIIGNSPALLNLLDQLLIVAPTDTSVLITGESGTGKEIIAQTLHRVSNRKNKPMIAVNCAALPADLIESILFGHEKGAFTGASNRKIGKFEEAEGGTIFLDEIGEMPFDLQAKLLRVLQEKEIERVGGGSPIRVDLRIIAATNLNLEKEIVKGKFRLDLFFRLNVFPLEVPALRARKDDISLLVHYFIEKHSRELGKVITGTTKKFMDQLLQYDWPGNIRELEHLIIRSILLAKHPVLDESLLDLGISIEEKPPSTGTKTIAENERDHIIDVMNQCKGRISGPGGAAELLGIPATTLNSKMKKLGLRK